MIQCSIWSLIVSRTVHLFFQQSVNRKFVLSQSPAWLRKKCGRMLSDILMGPDGVLNIIKGMLGNVPGKIFCNSNFNYDTHSFENSAKRSFLILAIEKLLKY